MTKKKTTVSESALILGAAPSRGESIKPKRSTGPKHSKAKPVPGVAPQMTEMEEVALQAFLYAETRGFKGGSQDEDWLRAEQEVHLRRERG